MNIEILENIAKNLIPVERLVTGSAYIIGIFFAIKAIMGLKAMGESRSSMAGGQNHVKESVIYIVVASIFIYFPTALDIMIATTFGQPGIYGYPNNDSAAFIFGGSSMIGQSLTTIVQVIGIIAFVRGWILISRASGHGQQPGGTGKGLIHVLGGILAMNIVLTLQIINNTLYGTS